MHEKDISLNHLRLKTDANPNKNIPVIFEPPPVQPKKAGCGEGGAELGTMAWVALPWSPAAAPVRKEGCDTKHGSSNAVEPEGERSRQQERRRFGQGEGCGRRAWPRSSCRN